MRYSSLAHPLKALRLALIYWPAARLGAQRAISVVVASNGGWLWRGLSPHTPLSWHDDCGARPAQAAEADRVAVTRERVPQFAKGPDG